MNHRHQNFLNPLRRQPPRSAPALTVRRQLVTGVILGALALGIGACGRSDSSGREVWAEVDGTPIYRDQVERAYRGRVPPGTDPGSSEQALNLKLNVLNELIDEQLLVAHASHSQIAVSEAEVDKALAERQSPYSKEEFQKRLAAQGLTEADLRQDVRKSLIIQRLLNKEISSRITVSDAEISGYYDRNKSSFSVPETEYHLAQIQVTPPASLGNPRGGGANMKEAERKVQALYQRLKGGEDFAAVAQQFSDDPKTRPGGGDMGFIPASSLNQNPQVKKLIESLKVGQISGPLAFGNSFHIIRLLGREDPGQHPLSDPRVQATIRRGLMSEKQGLLQAAYVEELRNHSKIVDHLAQRIVASAGQVQDKAVTNGK